MYFGYFHASGSAVVLLRYPLARMGTYGLPPAKHTLYSFCCDVTPPKKDVLHNEWRTLIYKIVIFKFKDENNSKYHVPFFSYTWNYSYLIKSLPIQRIYVASVNLSICLDQENCQVEVELLKNDILPQSICELNPGYTDKGNDQSDKRKNIKTFYYYSI